MPMNKTQTIEADIYLHQAEFHPLPEGGDPAPLFPREVLEEMTMGNLNSLQRALHSVSEIVAAMSNQPRFFNAETREYSLAGEQMVDLLEALSTWQTRIANVAAQARPTSSRELEEQAWGRLAYFVGYPDSVAEVSVLAAQASRDIQDAKRREKVK